jgi:Zinc dependent phospholipase C
MPGIPGIGSRDGTLPTVQRAARTGIVWLMAMSLCLVLAGDCSAYSVLSHEAIIDAVWTSQIKPLLRKRYPNATREDLREAHAYAYGGSIIQDLGYYPYGDKLFSDLTHYVRSGDFVEALLRDAQDIREYAFAIGAMSHYAADNEGHMLAVNRAVPILYPELARKYGSVMTFEDSPLAHVKTEFGFDVLEVAKGRFAPDAYHDFIGFEVARPLLERAFRETYGLELNTVLKHETKAIESYRHDISKVIPRATKVAWQIRRKDIQQDLPGMTRNKFLYNISRAGYEKNWGKDYRRPNFAEKFFAFIFRLIPKIGPLKILKFRTPTPQTEQLFEKSFNTTLDRFRGLLAELDKGSVSVPNDNIDVGVKTPPGAYHLNDDTYAELLQRLANQKFAGVTPELRANILRFYADPSAPNAAKRSHRRWARVQRELIQLRSVTPTQLAAAHGPAIQ